MWAPEGFRTFEGYAANWGALAAAECGLGYSEAAEINAPIEWDWLNTEAAGMGGNGAVPIQLGVFAFQAGFYFEPYSETTILLEADIADVIEYFRNLIIEKYPETKDEVEATNFENIIINMVNKIKNSNISTTDEDF